MKRRRKGPARHPDDEDRHNAAAALAIMALTFIAEDPERLGRFLALSGIGPESIREAARESGFLLGVLDHVVSDESLLLAFSSHSGVDPGDIARSRDALAGEIPHSP